MTYYERYMQGEYEQVWDELVQMGADVRQEPVYTDALAVARETMRRVRRNIEMLIERLPQRGFLFGYDRRLQFMEGSTFFEKQRTYLEQLVWIRKQPPIFLSAMYLDEAYALDEQYLFPAVPEFRYEIKTQEDIERWKSFLPDGWAWPVRTSTYVDEIERTIGPVPLSVRAWYEIVGGVNFFGYHPQWDEIACSFHSLVPGIRNRNKGHNFHLMEDCDPLQVKPLDEDALRQMQKQSISEPSQIHIFEFADEHRGKTYGSGDPTPYMFRFPDDHADQVLGPLRFENLEDPYFVQYLRFSMQWAGFPGISDWIPKPQEDIDALTRDLIPF